MTVTTDTARRPGRTRHPGRPVGPAARRERPDARPARVRPPNPAHQPAAEWSLALVTLAVIVAFTRVFSGGAFVWPLVVVGGLTHLGLALARRRGLGLGVATLAHRARVRRVWRAGCSSPTPRASPCRARTRRARPAKRSRARGPPSSRWWHPPNRSRGSCWWRPWPSASPCSWPTGPRSGSGRPSRRSSRR